MSLSDFSGAHTVTGIVKPEWIDINGHMNVAYYVLAFDLAVDTLWAQFGISDEYIRNTRGSTFAVESHVSYLRELKEGEPYCIQSQILAYDEKRIHHFQRMFHADDEYLAATAEWMNLYVDLDTRRVSAWPDAVLQSLGEQARKQESRPFPVEAGRQMAVAKPLYRLDGRESS
jgi:acyl-CoA thioester hydrolase